MRLNASTMRRRVLCLAVLMALAGEVPAAGLSVTATDRDGEPVGDVAVYATPVGIEPPNRVPEQPLVMDQLDEQFRPHILIVQTGSAVSFPNHDTVSHHVYSFSKAKSFELPLYKGTPHSPVVFDRPGVIDLGCNIHDHMEAHIVVVDTPYFGKTTQDGRAQLAGLPPGEYAIEVYTPRLRSNDLPPPTTVVVNGDDSAEVEIRISARLRPPHTTESESLIWSHY